MKSHKNKKDARLERIEKGILSLCVWLCQTNILGHQDYMALIEILRGESDDR